MLKNEHIYLLLPLDIGFSSGVVDASAAIFINSSLVSSGVAWFANNSLPAKEWWLSATAQPQRSALLLFKLRW